MNSSAVWSVLEWRIGDQSGWWMVWSLLGGLLDELVAILWRNCNWQGKNLIGSIWNHWSNCLENALSLSKLQSIFMKTVNYLKKYGRHQPINFQLLDKINLLVYLLDSWPQRCMSNLKLIGHWGGTIKFFMHINCVIYCSVTKLKSLRLFYSAPHSE